MRALMSMSSSLLEFTIQQTAGDSRGAGSDDLKARHSIRCPKASQLRTLPTTPVDAIPRVLRRRASRRTVRTTQGHAEAACTDGRIQPITPQRRVSMKTAPATQGFRGGATALDRDVKSLYSPPPRCSPRAAAVHETTDRRALTMNSQRFLDVRAMPGAGGCSRKTGEHQRHPGPEGA